MGHLNKWCTIIKNNISARSSYSSRRRNSFCGRTNRRAPEGTSRSIPEPEYKTDIKGPIHLTEVITPSKCAICESVLLWAKDCTHTDEEEITLFTKGVNDIYLGNVEQGVGRKYLTLLSWIVAAIKPYAVESNLEII